MTWIPSRDSYDGVYRTYTDNGTEYVSIRWSGDEDGRNTTKTITFSREQFRKMQADIKTVFGDDE